MVNLYKVSNLEERSQQSADGANTDGDIWPPNQLQESQMPRNDSLTEAEIEGEIDRQLRDRAGPLDELVRRSLFGRASRVAIVGGSESGKTTLLDYLLQNGDRYFPAPGLRGFHAIFLVVGVQSDKTSAWEKLHPNVLTFKPADMFHGRFDSVFQEQLEDSPKDASFLLLCDDLLTSADSLKAKHFATLADSISKYSNNASTTCIITLQLLTQANNAYASFINTLMSQCGVWVLFPARIQKQTLQKFRREFLPDYPKDFIREFYDLICPGGGSEAGPLVIVTDSRIFNCLQDEKFMAHDNDKKLFYSVKSIAPQLRLLLDVFTDRTVGFVRPPSAGETSLQAR